MKTTHQKGGPAPLATWRAVQVEQDIKEAFIDCVAALMTCDDADFLRSFTPEGDMEDMAAFIKQVKTAIAARRAIIAPIIAAFLDDYLPILLTRLRKAEKQRGARLLIPTHGNPLSRKAT